MKAIIAILLVLVVCFAHAEEIKVVNGQVMIVQLVDSGVKVTPEAAKYPDAVAQVFAERGKEAAVVTEVTALVTGMFHYEIRAMQIVGVKYESARNMVVATTEPKVLESGSNIFWFPVLWFIGILAMIVSSVLVRLGKYNLKMLTTISFYFSTGTSLGIAILITHTLVVLVVAVIVIIFTVIAKFAHDNMYVDDTVSIRSFQKASIAYFIAMVALAVSVYYPLFF